MTSGGLWILSKYNTKSIVKSSSYRKNFGNRIMNRNRKMYRNRKRYIYTDTGKGAETRKKKEQEQVSEQ